MATRVASPTAPVPFTAPSRDRYDIEIERAALKDLIDADDLEPFMSDPRYPRYVELERREALLASTLKTHQLRDAAQPEVEFREASGIRTGLGALIDEEADRMALHTRESSRLFMGRAVEPGKPGFGQSGGKKVGAALRQVWYLSGNNNPYADFALIEASTRMTQQIQALDALTSAMEEQLAQLKRRGLSFSVVRAEAPVSVELGFRSPYGYSVVNLISSFDYHVRVVKTLVRKDLMTDAEGYAAVFAQTRACRSIFERAVWFQLYLMRDELRVLSRSDWLPSADTLAQKRVQAAVALFGELPREVFNGSTTPRHSRRRLDVSAEELRLLNEVPLVYSTPELESATAALA